MCKIGVISKQHSTQEEQEEMVNIDEDPLKYLQINYYKIEHIPFDNGTNSI